jgi:hypothetical protein
MTLENSVFMLSVAKKPYILSVFILSIVAPQQGPFLYSLYCSYNILVFLSLSVTSKQA